MAKPKGKYGLFLVDSFEPENLFFEKFSPWTFLNKKLKAFIHLLSKNTLMQKHAFTMEKHLYWKAPYCILHDDLNDQETENLHINLVLLSKYQHFN